ncbi:MAG: [FeFe] hydrogenase H-cluster maturation GTPase HydF [Anaerovoracaceae bacterium]
MGLNQTPSADRIHIGIFGRRNAGKSSLINAVTNQNLAIVADVAGTTTDPVRKAMELLPLGPVMVIDTPGIDDEGELGALRVKKSYQVLNKTDIALLVVDGQTKAPEDELLLGRIREKKIPYVVAYNKWDLSEEARNMEKETGTLTPPAPRGPNEIDVSADRKININELREMIAAQYQQDENAVPICADLLKPGDTAVLVVPIDSAAPKGRLILPQQQTIRDALEADASVVVVKENGLKEALAGLNRKPALVITDSQAFGSVSKDTPGDVLLTSFSILMARHKGILEQSIRGAAAIDRLKDGDRVLISEGCTHHRQCDDIGTVKLPAWLQNHTGAQLEFSFTSGTEFDEDLTKYQLIVHCGGCMLNEREMRYRMRCAQEQGVPMTNYGLTIAHVHGILKRSLGPFPKLAALLEERD